MGPYVCYVVDMSLEDDPFRTPEEAAHLLSISLRHLKYLRNHNDGPTPTYLGHRTVRYRQSAIEAYARGEQRTDG